MKRKTLALLMLALMLIGLAACAPKIDPNGFTQKDLSVQEYIENAQALADQRLQFIKEHDIQSSSAFQRQFASDKDMQKALKEAPVTAGEIFTLYNQYALKEMGITDMQKKLSPKEKDTLDTAIERDIPNAYALATHDKVLHRYEFPDGNYIESYTDGSYLISDGSVTEKS